MYVCMLCVYVCMYVCMYVYKIVCVCMYARVHTYYILMFYSIGVWWVHCQSKKYRTLVVMATVGQHIQIRLHGKYCLQTLFSYCSLLTGNS